MTIATQLQQSQSQEAPQFLTELTTLSGTGYWRFAVEHSSAIIEDWYVGVVQGRVVYTGKRWWSVAALLKTIIRFDSHSRQKGARAILHRFQEEAATTSITPDATWVQLKQELNLTEDSLETALKYKIYNDLDALLSTQAKRVEFIASDDLAQYCIISGLDPSALVSEMLRRQRLWSQVLQQIPSVHCYPVLNPQQLECSQLSTAQRDHVRVLTQPHKSLNEIATLFAKDVLDIAMTFAKLAGLGILSFDTGDTSAPKRILVVDDSPLILKQFDYWLKAQGYAVGTCQDANNALDTIAQYDPAVVFIDINMPGISGFELVKLIRQQPDISDISIVILTGEQKLSNKYRAQWSGCEFLTKPLSAEDVKPFQEKLQNLLATLLSESKKVVSA